MVMSVFKIFPSFAAAVMLLTMPSMTLAKPHYVMSVVKEARVDSGPGIPRDPPLECQTEQVIAPGSDRLGWIGGPKRQKVMSLGRNRTLFVTQNFDGAVNSLITVWLAEKVSKDVRYFALTELAMETAELPSFYVDGDVLSVEADILVADSSQADEVIQVPNLRRELHQTIKIKERSPEGLSLRIFSCSRFRN
jgi:hypothetical protein